MYQILEELCGSTWTHRFIVAAVVWSLFEWTTYIYGQASLDFPAIFVALGQTACVYRLRVWQKSGVL